MSSDAAYEAGYDDGLDDGFAEARRRISEPMIVHDARGTHTYRDQGYSPPHAAHLFVCDEHGCRQIGRTDEHAALYESAHYPTEEP